ncbi:hypothetical protein QZM92_18295 [Burkholderia multivorans]|uniref:hypothetical protein n=1 Tax=Burkholderia multivorans TaxID=87883 RepID=UPI0011B2728C|nr:hypothetical protein [Burkholderia multivorans]MBU9574067.1 hypothetical protein [Burkholderia multivorans]MDN7963962.1 hypothetical protein [Burkholderia multivorans]
MSDHPPNLIDELARRYADLQRRYAGHMQVLRARLDNLIADEAANRPDVSQLDEAARLEASMRHMLKYDGAIAAAFSAYDAAVAIDRRGPRCHAFPHVTDE